MARYLITGVAGFVGTTVSKLLMDDGNEIIGLDSINDSYDPAIKHVRLDHLTSCDLFTFLNLDICDPGQFNKIAYAKFDAVIHLAARAGVRQSILNPQEYLQTNIMGTLNVLDFCKNTDIKKMVLASTSSLYGETNSSLISEISQTDFPLTPYSVSKKSAELLCYSYHYQYGIDISINRFFTVYGQFGRPDMSIFKFIKLISEKKPITIFGDGTQTRDFTHVEDVARGTIASLKDVQYDIFNLGSNSPVSVNKVVELIEDILGIKAIKEFLPKNNADVSSTNADVSKARKILNWKPQLSFYEGLKKTIDWYMANRSWLKSINIGQ
ncbi:MAG TPA: nucleotide sugar epimerase [Dehalococcoidia bacterium]|nr:nucleotide sugar epimerase [Dehalococcoidia bacterium]